MQEGFSQFDPVAMLEQVAQQRTQEARRGDAQVNELLPASPEAAKEAGQIDRDVIGDRGPARSAPTATAWGSMATSRAAPTASCSCSA